MPQDGQDIELFPELNVARYGDAPARRRGLFLGRYLRQAGDDYRLRDKQQADAHKIILKWADMDSEGRLRARNESKLKPEFLTEIFGQALGYTLFSEALDRWNIEPEYAVNGGQVDAAIGLFEHDRKCKPRAMIELKGPAVNVDRDRSQGRTPVQQCWDYLNAVPECPWGIVCNMVSFRLYHRTQGSRAYQLFTLQDLRDEDTFRQFYYVFQKGGLLPGTMGQVPRADELLDKTSRRQREVGDELYDHYHDQRVALVGHLCRPPYRKPLDKAIYITQRLMDRIIFLAFCEDRGLLPERIIHTAYSQRPPFTRVTNPIWQNFLNLFRAVDQGDPAHKIPGYNGGLFRCDTEVDDLSLEDDWMTVFETIGSYDFGDEVNVDVLGHLFERSVNDLERLRLGGFFGEPVKAAGPKMGKSAERKKLGIYYTPPEFTKFITYNTVAKLANDRMDELAARAGLSPQDLAASKPDAAHATYWRDCLSVLRKLRIVDPACGSGAFLIQAYDVLDELYQYVLEHLVFHEGEQAKPLYDQISDFILHDNLFGVDLSPEAVEISQLALWIRSARAGRTLADLSSNIVCGNSLVSDKVHPHAMDWRETFKEVFSRPEGGFDCVIGNPPWERLKCQEREFFDAAAPAIAGAMNASTRGKMIADLERTNSDLYRRYRDAKAAAEGVLNHVRTCGRFPLSGRGDINTYAVFAELAHSIVAPGGLVGLLVPSGIATDHTTREFFGELVRAKAIRGLYDFENKAPVFPDVHRSFKFSVLLFGGAKRKTRSMDFVFFARAMGDLNDKGRHISLTAQDLRLLNPNTRTCPVFRSRRDADLTKAIYRRVPVLVDRGRKEGGNPWDVRFFTMFHQTNDSALFRTREQLEAERFTRDGACWKKGKKRYLPLYEAKMVQAYDHRAASVVVKAGNWMRQGQTAETTLVEHQNPEYCVEPRWWVDEAEVHRVLPVEQGSAHICFKDVTSPTNMRTMIASFIPHVGAVNSAPLLLTDPKIKERALCCLLANMNSFALDFAARQKVGGLHLNFFIVEQLPVFPPEFYLDACPWNKRQKLVDWVSRRVFKLTCTSNDMVLLAKAAGFTPPVHKWKDDERADLLAELDAAYMLLYGIERSDAEYILSTFSGAGGAGDSLLSAGTSFSRVLEHYDRLRESCRQ